MWPFKTTRLDDKLHVRHARLCEICCRYEKALRQIRDGIGDPKEVAYSVLPKEEESE